MIGDQKNPKGRWWRRIISERASVYLEYALLSSVLFAVAIAAFSPSSAISSALGIDLAFREILIKMPIF